MGAFVRIPRAGEQPVVAVVSVDAPCTRIVRSFIIPRGNSNDPPSPHRYDVISSV